MSAPDRRFHVRDNIFFTRQPSTEPGGAAIRITAERQGWSEARPIWNFLMSVDEFASVIASMSAEGETPETFYQARRLLAEPDASGSAGL